MSCFVDAMWERRMRHDGYQFVVTLAAIVYSLSCHVMRLLANRFHQRLCISYETSSHYDAPGMLRKGV